MAECLGLFVQDNLIKYAKISKENDSAKIENFGVKFYDQDIEKTIKQIVDETFSYRTPISINLAKEKYANSEVFSLLKDVDQKKAVKTEFEYLCNEMSKNRLTLDYKYIISNEQNDKDKRTVLYTFAEKGDIAESIQLLDPYRMVNLSPVSLAINSITKEENCVIVNLEDRTEITTVVNGIPTKVDTIDLGMNEILKKITERENSTSKAYEICKNTTLYTASSQNLQTENNEYLEIIVPIIYQITEEINKVLEKNETNIEKIYITGAGVIINNIDLYFQEKFLNYKCEILAPYFVDKTSLKINIKDYIEVNSAIAMAMQVLEKKNKGVNFSNNQEKWEKIRDLLTSDVSSLGKNKVKSPKAHKEIKVNFKEINCIRFTYSVFTLLIVYIIITAVLHNQIDKKTNLAQEIIDDTKVKTQKVNEYTTLIDARTKNYEAILEQLKEASERAEENYRSKNAIPNLLSEIMFAIPKEAQILSLENTADKHIIIKAQASEYQYLGYFKSELQNRAILTNVTSTSGTMVDDMIQVTIEGDLPY